MEYPATAPKTVFDEQELVKANSSKPLFYTNPVPPEPSSNLNLGHCYAANLLTSSYGASGYQYQGKHVDSSSFMDSERHDSGLGSMGSDVCADVNYMHAAAAYAYGAGSERMDTSEATTNRTGRLSGPPPNLIVPTTSSMSDDEGLGLDEEGLERDSVITSPPPLKPSVTSHTSTNKPRKPKTNHSKKLSDGNTRTRTQHRTKKAKASHNSPSTNKPTDKKNSRAEKKSADSLVDLLLPNDDGDNGFHLCAIHQNEKCFKRLMSYLENSCSGLNSLDFINDQNKLLQTPLHLAVHTQQTGMVASLLSRGASLTTRDHKGNTPLLVACKQSSPKCLEEIKASLALKPELIVEAADIRNNDGQSCVHEATANSNTHALKVLKDLGVDLDMKELRCGKTALHLAVEADSLAMTQFLVETCLVDVNCATYAGTTPLHIAASNGNLIAVAYLMSMGANPELLTDEGDSPLDYAASNDVHTFLTKAAALKWL